MVCQRTHARTYRRRTLDRGRGFVAILKRTTALRSVYTERDRERGLAALV